MRSFQKKTVTFKVRQTFLFFHLTSIYLILIVLNTNLSEFLYHDCRLYILCSNVFEAEQHRFNQN